MSRAVAFAVAIAVALSLVAGADAFHARALRRLRRVAITVGAEPPRDAFSSVGTVSLSYRDELGDAHAFDAPVRAHAAPTPDASFRDVLLPSAPRQFTFTGANTTVFVLDSGCAGDEPGVSFVADEDETDVAGHGTAVMGIVKTVSPQARAVCVKVFDRKLTGTVGRTMQAFAWSRQRCVGSCVALLAGGGTSPLLSQFVQSLVSPSFVVVASAGNTEGQPCEDPANAPSVVSVGALGATGAALATYSAAGPCVSLLAPGWIEIAPKPVLVGTSYAAAAVAAVAAQLVQQDDSLDDVKAELVRGSSFRAPARAVVSTALRRNTTRLVVAVPPYPPLTQWCGAANETKWRWSLPRDHTLSFVAPTNFSMRIRNVASVSSASGVLRVDTDEGVASVNDADDRRRVVAFGANGTVRVGTSRAFLLSFWGGFTSRVSVALEGCEFANITMRRGVDGDDVTPVLPPCGRRTTPVACVAKPQSPADSSCVWMGGGIRCVRADSCAFKTRNVCERRRPTCRWSRDKCAGGVS